MRHPATFFNILNFKREFKNFRMFKDVRISKILYVMQCVLQDIRIPSVFNIFFSSGRSFLYQYKKKVSFASSQKQLSQKFSECSWKLVVEVYFYYCQPWERFKKVTCQYFIQILLINTKLFYFLSIIFLICNGFSKIKMNLKEYCNRIVYQLTQHLQIWRSYSFSWSYFGFCKRR